MTRINTNVGSLVAQNRLRQTNNDLNTSLTRLSTGLRINTGKDDPAGLIASEALRSDITSINKALSNTQRASQIIATADSALGQVSSLLNDVRGLVVEAANNGALSDDEIAANQLQIDSSLEAINRIAQTTTFQGRKLLDGSLDFTTTAGSNFDKISDLQIDQANLGTSNSVTVNIGVTAAATKGQVDITGIAASTNAANAFADVSLANPLTNGSGGSFTFDGQTLDLAVTGSAPANAQGAESNGVKNIAITYSQASNTVTYDDTTDTITVTSTAASLTGTALAAQLTGAGFASTATGTSGGGVTTGSVSSTALTGGRDAGAATFRVQADTAGAAANGVTVTLIEDAAVTANTAVASINGSNNIEVRVNGTVTYNDIASQIDGLTGYSASVTSSSGDQNYIDTIDTPPAAATLNSGSDGTGGLLQDVVFALSGKNGSETFNFKAGTSIAQVRDAINLVSDATGVSAGINATTTTTLELTSSEYGSNAFVDIEVITEATGGTITAGIGNTSKSRDTGTDLIANINGNSATSVGNKLSINTATLDFSATIEAGFTGNLSYNITGGGALFQLGGDVVSNQQARLGISSVSTSKLGGVSGRLYELGSGQGKALATDTVGAGKVIDEVINKVTSLRGRLGAFQATTLESNSVSLNDTVANLYEAESSIRDADFAAETARLTRAQILVQSGTSVLGIANQNPQNVLGLLR